MCANSIHAVVDGYVKLYRGQEDPSYTMKKVTVAASDTGGAKAVLPVARELRNSGVPIQPIDRGFLGDCFRVDQDLVSDDTDGVMSLFGSGDVSVHLSGTSIRDPFVLTTARAARSAGVPVVFVLDNWMNYRRRLEIDGGPTFEPDIYALMDEYAVEMAYDEGLSLDCLVATGQPALAGLPERYRLFKDARDESDPHDHECFFGTMTIVYISEPAKMDYRPGSPHYRGYTEDDVLRVLCRLLSAHSDQFSVAIYPHPHENRRALEDLWSECRGELRGMVVDGVSGERGIFAEHFVCGMTSILLYEAWLLGKSVLSLQPGLCREDLAYLGVKDGCVLMRDAEPNAEMFSEWLMGINRPRSRSGVTDCECIRHGKAPRKIADLIESLRIS